MVGGIVDRIRLSWIARAASDPSSMSRSRAIAALGSWPYADDAFVRLSKIVEAELDRTIYGSEALEALCRLRCDRATGYLEQALKSPRLHGSDLNAVIASLLEPWRGNMVPALAERARLECRGGGFPVWFEDAMALVATPEAAKALDDLIDDVLNAGLGALARDPPEIVIAEAADGYLERRTVKRAAEGRPRLHLALIDRYLEIAERAPDFDMVAQAVANLESFDMPESREALAVFRSQPSRPLTRTIRGVTNGTEPERRTEIVYSSVFGQPTGEEERAAVTRAEEEARERERAAEAEAEAERRRKVFADLLVQGAVKDVAAYAEQCLTDPAHTPSLDRLGDYLAVSKSNSLAANLARRIAQADRTVLEDHLLAEGSMTAVRTLEQLACPHLWHKLFKIELDNWESGRRVMREVTRPLCERFADEMSQTLVKILRDEDTTSRRLPAIKELLGWCGDIAIKRVRHLLSDPRWPVRRHAVDFLAQAGTEQARYALEEFLEVEADGELRLIAEGGLSASAEAARN